MDRLLSMRAFQQVVDDGGFAAAARSMDMSPAVMTRLITDLELHLGARLLQRTTRKLSLTEAGQAYLQRVRHILNDVDEAETSTRQQTDELAGLLRIHTQPVMAVYILAPLVAEFRRRYPKVVLDITVDSPLIPPIEDFDLTILGAGPLYDANVVARPVIVSEGLLCASPRYLSSAGMPQQPEDLRKHAVLRLSQAGARQREWLLINPEEGDREVAVDIKPVLVANHTDTLLRATLDGAGISAQPLDLVANYLHDGQLQRLMAPWITGRFTLYAALPSRKYVPARARVFMEFLIEQTRLKAAQAEPRQTDKNTAGAP
ncbi:LysR family transcriptional regulator [Polaromonas sp. A23]|uniref:LysR family transcriptional regulator n=1 Tax=Polaromonas sp. A23 TaxID=1944133 RepID=UPI00098459BB|nr:LysR family transcriptional regulator [Polaromonas sp. A23]OOG40978.1 LysR family transcriptional regulator [Polaromonas sp. A23]